jgi:cytochrome c oxidase subunit 1/cytochrome c oxidase subunit I+III
VPAADSVVRLERLWETEHSLWGAFATLDHKRIGLRYLVTALIFLALGGIEAVVMRVQLAASDMRVLTPEAYDQLFSMHGITMIFWYASPVLSGFGNYLIPLMIGARDMAFPRANALSYWVFLLSGAFLYASMFVGQAPHAGWFAYAPYTDSRYSPGLNMDFYALALIFLTISTTVGAVNFIVTIMRHRAPGMTVPRMPLMLYSTFTTSVLVVLALPALTVACLMLLLDRHWGTHFFETDGGGTPLLWQHLFWFFGHPWVYIIFLPATGMISMILPVFARRPIVGYEWVAGATVLTGITGLAVWVHHMFAAGMSAPAMKMFAAASMVISVFSTIQVFAWIATLWSGKPVIRAPLLFALGFIALFIIGGLNGTITAFIPFDWQIHDTYFVVAHLHTVIVASNVFPVMAAFYYWLPKMTGRLMNERAARWSFWMMAAGFLVAFFPMQLLGLEGMNRRIYTYGPETGWDSTNLIVSVGSALFAVGVAVSVANWLWSSRRGATAGHNPWNADSLEWSSESPPPSYGTVHLPTVASRHPLWDSHDEEHDPENARTLEHQRVSFATSAWDARLLGLSHMPDDTLAPLVLSLLLAALFTGALMLSIPATTLSFGACLLAMAWWFWPKPERTA